MKTLTSIILIIAAIALFFMYTNQAYIDLRSQMDVLAHIKEAQANASKLAEKTTKLTDMRNNLSQDDIDRVTKMLPDSVENVGLIIEINNLAVKNGLGYVKNPQINQGATAGSISTGSAGAGQKYGSLSMTFNVSGTYDQLQSFLKDMETYIRLVDVMGLTFTSNPTGRYDYTITIQTYWLK
jgi:Tfp pilus assembly protein PilO